MRKDGYLDLLSESWNTIVYIYFIYVFDLLDVQSFDNSVCICIVCGFLCDYHIKVERKRIYVECVDGTSFVSREEQ